MSSAVVRVLATRPAIPPLIVRVAAGIVFLSFSIGKFTRHDSEAAALDRYGIPHPGAATYLVGLLELGGGILLVLGLLTRPTALALAVNMAVAISTAGRIDGGPVHLGLAPALLACMLYLLWAGGGARSIDLRLTARVARGTAPTGRVADADGKGSARSASMSSRV